VLYLVSHKLSAAESHTTMTHSLQLRFAITLVVFAISSLSRGADSMVQANDEKPIRALVAVMGEAFAKLDAHAFSLSSTKMLISQTSGE
jgi:hypothetical protein